MSITGGKLLADVQPSRLSLPELAEGPYFIIATLGRHRETVLICEKLADTLSPHQRSHLCSQDDAGCKHSATCLLMLM